MTRCSHSPKFLNTTLVGLHVPVTHVVHRVAPELELLRIIIAVMPGCTDAVHDPFDLRITDIFTLRADEDHRPADGGGGITEERGISGGGFHPPQGSHGVGVGAQCSGLGVVQGCVGGTIFLESYRYPGIIGTTQKLRNRLKLKLDGTVGQVGVNKKSSGHAFN